MNISTRQPGNTRHTSESGFTLIELTIGVAIASILATVGLTAGYNTINQTMNENTVSAIATTTHTVALKAMTSFDKSEIVETAEAEMAQKYPAYTFSITETGTHSVCVEVAHTQSGAEATVGCSSTLN